MNSPHWLYEHMTLAGDLLHQFRIDKGYGRSRAAFVARFGIRWGEHTQRFLEVGRTLMREDAHLTHLVETGLVKDGSHLYRQFRSAIEHDQCQKYSKTNLTARDLPAVLPPIPVRSDGEGEEERLVREVFEAFQIDGLFDLINVEPPCPVAGINTSEGLINSHPNQPQADLNCPQFSDGVRITSLQQLYAGGQVRPRLNSPSR